MPRPTPDDILIRITIDNRGPDAADLHVLPQLWARNTWDWRTGIHEPSPDPVGRGVDCLAQPHAERRLSIDTGADMAVLPQ